MRNMFGLLAVAAGSLLWAGALTVEMGNPATNPEALAKHAVLVARTTACHSPEKTAMTATAEGLVDGQRRSISLKVIPLSTPGTYALTQEWPSTGTWAVRVVARNPEYKDYATGVLIRVDANSVKWACVKHYYHQPTDEEVLAILEGHPGADRASLN